LKLKNEENKRSRRRRFICQEAKIEINSFNHIAKTFTGCTHSLQEAEERNILQNNLVSPFLILEIYNFLKGNNYRIHGKPVLSNECFLEKL